MKINKNSWHYRFWRKSFDYPSEAPLTIDLCRYCHRIFWRLIGISFLVAGTAYVALVLLYLLLYMGLWRNTGVALSCIGAIGLVIGAIQLYSRWLNIPVKPVESQGLVTNWLSARKQQVCPVIEFSDDKS